MTISSTNTKNSYSGDGSTVAFSYTFKILDDDDIQVILRTDATGTETVQTKTTDYTVSGVGNAGGGTITFGSAPAATETVVLLRNVPLTQTTDYTPNDPFPAATHEDALDKLTLMAQDTQEEVDRSIKLSRTNTMTSTEFTVGATTRANKIFAFDSSGELAVTQEIGTFQGDWAASTAYAERDLVKDTSTNNIFIVNSAHTSSGSQPLTTNPNSSKYDLIVDAAAATTSATNAASSATAAAASATAAAASESAAATSETNAAASEAGVAADAAAAAASAASASTSATNASTSETNASNSASAASTSATNAATSATSASNSASAAGTSESNAATSATNASNSASAAATSASNAATSESNASTSETNAASSASSAASDASAAATSAAAAAASFDAFDDIYLGAKASAPTVDNDGDALTEGDQYFNTTNNTLFVWNGSAWQAASPDIVADTTPQLGGDLDLNSNDITGTGNIDVTGTVTADAATIDNGVLTVNDTGTRKVEISGNGFGDFTSNPVLDGGIEFTNQFGHVFSAGVSNSNNFDVLDGATKIARFSGGGDISFYDNTGTTQGLFWDASTQRLGLGSTAPNGLLELRKNSAAPYFVINRDNNKQWGASVSSGGNLAFQYGTTYANMIASTAAMSITSGGDVGIGTTSPETILHATASSAIIRLTSDANGTSGVDFGDSADTNIGRVLYDNSDNSMRFTTNTSERMRITSGGDVGIGSTTPGAKIDINSSTEGDVYFRGGTGALRQLELSTFATASNHAGHDFNIASGSGAFSFSINGSEAARIDSSGNLLVGTTDINIGTNSGTAVTGGVISDGTATFGKSGNRALVLNRGTSDGNIAVFRKDGTTIGLIGVSGSKMFITTGNAGVKFRDDLTAIIPCNSDGSNSDDDLDWGYSSVRWDDIYATNGTIQTSDANEKNTIADSDLGLDFINRLSPKSYIFNGKTRTHYGLIAQDVETVLGDISKPTSGFAGFIKSDISEEQDGSEYRYGLRYTEFVGPLIKALQEADAKIEALEARIAALEGA